MTVRTSTESTEQARAAWSLRVRRVGGFIQVAFAAFWLLRGGLNVGGTSGALLTASALVLVLIVLVYGIRVTAGQGRRPVGVEAKRVEHSVNLATVIEILSLIHI